MTHTFKIGTQYDITKIKNLLNNLLLNKNVRKFLILQ